MLILLVCCLFNTFLVAKSVKEETIYPRSPYAFGYNVYDEQGTKVHRLESADEAGVVKGEYGYIDAQGISRLVSYVADHNGYRASVSSNEPGVQAHSPASTVFQIHGPGAYYHSQDGAGVPIANNFAGYVPYVYAYKNVQK